MKMHQSGFTLMELMIVLSLAAAIVALGAPNFNEFRRNNRLTGVANDFLGAVITARTEAIKRQVGVSICPSENPLAEDAVCGGGEFRGWIAFADPNQDCARTDDEVIVRAGARAEDAVNVVANEDASCISFAPTGFRQDIAGEVTLTNLVLCDDRGTAAQDGTDQSAARGVEIGRTGRARITRVIAELSAAPWPACGS